MKDAINRIAGMTYGVELEYTGASREKVAKAVAEAVGVEVYDRAGALVGVVEGRASSSPRTGASSRAPRGRCARRR